MSILLLILKILCSVYLLLNGISFIYAAIWYHNDKFYPRIQRILEGVLGVMFLSMVGITWFL
jgi:hypothetical protein